MYPLLRMRTIARCACNLKEPPTKVAHYKAYLSRGFFNALHELEALQVRRSDERCVQA